MFQQKLCVGREKQETMRFFLASTGLQDNWTRVKENIHNLWESIRSQWMTVLYIWRVFSHNARSIIFISFGSTEECYQLWTRVVSLWLLCSLPVCVCVVLRLKWDLAWSRSETTFRSPLLWLYKNHRRSFRAASWMNPSGFTPCHCVCIWTVPTDLLPFIWNTRLQLLQSSGRI